MAQYDKIKWLERLERIRYEPRELGTGELEQMSLASALLTLAAIDHEREYKECHALAQHLLEKVPEPDDADLAEE